MKFKEKILKLGKRKNCFIALLLLALLAFSVLGGFNGAKSAKTEVNALSAPQTKNLDLKGVRYTYQTSLSELKNNYALFDAPTTSRFCQIHENGEGYNNVILNASKEDIYIDSAAEDVNQASLNKAVNILNNTIRFYKDGTLVENAFSNEIPLNTLDNKEVAMDFDIEDASSIDFLINEYNEANYQSYSEYRSGYAAYFLYLDSANPQNTILKGYAISQPINYNFKIEKIKGYRLALISFAFETTKTQEKNVIETIVPNDNQISSSPSGYVYNGYITIDNINFIDNDSANIISFDADYTQRSKNSETENEELPVFKGNILLSETNYDFNFINDIAKSDSYGTVPIFGKLFFGGDFNKNKPYNSPNIGFYVGRNTASFDAWTRTVYTSSGALKPYGAGFGEITYLSDEQYGLEPDGYSIIYQNQSRLLTLTQNNSLMGSLSGNSNYKALSSQVEDVLYNVNYVGDVEEIEFNEKVEEDFENLLKTTGLGAFIGLVIGLIFGNPLLGAAIGALWGFVVGIFPVIIDGLQAIFGKNAFNGLYNFFKSITEFFANFVDTIINFLISIITNPFVLVLIVIVAVVWVVMYLQKK